MSSELADQISDLSISKNEALSQFESTIPLTEQVRSDLLEEITKLSQNTETRKDLYELIIDDSYQFLRSLKRIHDVTGAIITNTLQSASKSDKILYNLFSCIRSILKDDKEPESRLYYLGVYSSLVNHFKIANPQHLSLFLTFASSENDSLQRSILVLIIQNLKFEKEKTSEIVKEYLEVVSDEAYIDRVSFLNFVIVLEMCFPLVPEVCAGIYSDDKTKQHILNKIEQLTADDLELMKYVLKLIDSSCLVETCRNITVANYFQFLVQGCQFKSDHIRVLSSLNIVKLWKFLDTNKKSNDLINTKFLADILVSYLKSHTDEYIDCCIEGLMYLTLYWEVRKLLRMDVELIENLLDRLQHTSVETKAHHVQSFNFAHQYSILTIIANLTKLKDINDVSETERNTANLLKSVSAPTARSESAKEDQNSIKLFNEELLNKYKILDSITKLKTIKGVSSTNALNQVIRIVYHLSSQDKSMRVELVKQGAINIVLSFLLGSTKVDHNGATVTSVPDSDNSEVIETRVFALRSLARMLIAVDPNLSFKKYDIKTTVPFLKELLGPDISKYTGKNPLTGSESYLHEMSSLDKFESLLALTNIASSATSELKKYIIAQTFESFLVNFIVEFDDIRIQQAAWELIANMITEPILLAKFFNVQQIENKKRLELVVKLLNSKNVKLQCILAGLLVNAAEFDMICEVLVTSEFDHLIDIITEILGDETNEEDLILPISYLLVDLVYGAANINEELLTKLSSNAKLKKSIAHVLQTVNTREILQAILEVMKMINSK
ncbi:SWI5-dependent HO expression protein 4 [Spathaspora sp. JA1]|nr:SWI5-dependent HO expression protein 4 [Spathaspora sp. JA1]